MKRKRYPKEFKEQLIQEAKEIGSVPQVARRHEISAKTLYRWIKDSTHKAYKETPDNAKKITTYVPSPQEFRDLENENESLKKILGEKDLEISILRDLVKKANPGFRTK